MRKQTIITIVIAITAFIVGGVATGAAIGASSLAERLAGRVLLQVESKGEAWYVDPVTLTRSYLGRPSDAFNLMRAKGIGITNKDLEQIPTDNRFTKSHADKRYVYYTGEVTVSGTYQELKPGTLLGGLPCFYPDEKTKHLIPREMLPQGWKDNRSAWFCFKNEDTARSLLGLDTEIFNNDAACALKGNATVKISNYIVDTIESEVHDTAVLEEVFSATKPLAQSSCG